MRKVTNNLPQMQSAPYVIVTNGADRFTLYSNFLPIDRCGEGDVAGDVEVVGESAAVYLFGQAVVAGREVEQADMSIDGGSQDGDGERLRVDEQSSGMVPPVQPETDGDEN